METEKATQFCAKVEVQHAASYLDKQISMLNHRLEQERRGYVEKEKKNERIV